MSRYKVLQSAAVCAVCAVCAARLGNKSRPEKVRTMLLCTRPPSSRSRPSTRLCRQLSRGLCRSSASSVISLVLVNNLVYQHKPSMALVVTWCPNTAKSIPLFATLICGSGNFKRTSRNLRKTWKERFRLSSSEPKLAAPGAAGWPARWWCAPCRRGPRTWPRPGQR